MSKINQCWQTLFDKLPIVETIQQQGYFDLCAKQIKQYTREEPRLMTKIDSREQLPEILNSQNLSVLAIQNGLYRLSKADPFIDLPKDLIENLESYPSHELVFPSEITTLTPEDIRTESAGLDIAYISRLLHLYLEEKVLHLTLRGRLRGNLSFSLNNTPFDVQGVQIEVDAGYESPHAFHLFEAKKGLPTSLNFRQIFYPQLYWQSRIRKPCKTHGFFYHQNRFIFIPFTQTEQGYSAQPEHIKVFQFETNKRTLNLKAPSPFSPPNQKIPFPQANDLYKILYMIDKLYQEDQMTQEALFMSDASIAASLTCSRQYAYYLSALKWLNLIETEDTLSLNSQGKTIAQQPQAQQFASLAQIIFQDTVFKTLRLGNEIAAQNILEHTYAIHGSTLKRRIQCAQKWLYTLEQWIIFK